MSERERFERWIYAPPYELSVARYPEEGASWPGQYRDSRTQIAWEAWEEAIRALLAERDALARKVEVLNGKLDDIVVRYDYATDHLTDLRRERDALKAERDKWIEEARAQDENRSYWKGRCKSVEAERDALKALVMELRYAVREGYHMSPEGRAHLRKMDAAVAAGDER